jgi:hypothetical protein
MGRVRRRKEGDFLLHNLEADVMIKSPASIRPPMTSLKEVTNSTLFYANECPSELSNVF